MLARPDVLAPYAASEPAERSAPLERAVRRTPIRWRILAIAFLNSAVALALLALVWNGARVLGDAWSDLRRVHQSERFLAALDSDAERLQSLIHRFFAQTDPAVLEKIVSIRETLISRLRVQARLDPVIAEPTRALTEITERFISGFDGLRDTRASISLAYETRVLKPTRDIAGLFASLSNVEYEPSPAYRPSLDKARESFNAMILSANAFYLSGSGTSAGEAKDNVDRMKLAVAALLTTPLTDEQRSAFGRVVASAGIFDGGIEELTRDFAAQAALLRDAIDRNAEAMSSAIDRMNDGIRDLERSAQVRFDRTLEDVAAKLSVLALAFVILVVLMGLAIARSINEPLHQLRTAMVAITSGNYAHRVAGLAARDEIGEMARAVEYFRENAIARRETEEQLRQAKEHAESTLAELRATQTNLIEAEKLAALGGLVAGVAHEVNNPVGISLTVASSLAGRCDIFEKELLAGPIRRSTLQDFVGAARTASNQLVANLQRAGELVQSFKQVAVDRSHAERRTFDLKQATEQILASLRPTLRPSGTRLSVDVEDGITLHSYPGPLGQILTNLVLNAIHHAFPNRDGGAITITGRRRGTDRVEILFQDDGNGMSEAVQRHAFDPFFTTRRGSGGTGLGLHIVYNLVTGRLGGRIILTSLPGKGTTFQIVIPTSAPGEADREHAARGEVHAGS